MKIFIITFCLLLQMVFCQQSGQNIDKKVIPYDSLTEFSRHMPKEHALSSLLDIDSVSDADNYFMHTVIDSVSIVKFSFDAIYLTCFKAVVKYELYEYMKERFPSEYKDIMAIHTQHSVSVNGKVFSFNAIGTFGCHSIPESSLVAVDSKVLSLFSKNKHLGKLVILESILKIK